MNLTDQQSDLTSYLPTFYRPASTRLGADAVQCAIVPKAQKSSAKRAPDAVSAYKHAERRLIRPVRPWTASRGLSPRTDATIAVNPVDPRLTA